jgi:hypothetical protein
MSFIIKLSWGLKRSRTLIGSHQSHAKCKLVLPQYHCLFFVDQILHVFNYKRSVGFSRSTDMDRHIRFNFKTNLTVNNFRSEYYIHRLFSEMELRQKNIFRIHPCQILEVHKYGLPFILCQMPVMRYVYGIEPPCKHDVIFFPVFDFCIRNVKDKN